MKLLIFVGKLQALSFDFLTSGIFQILNLTFPHDKGKH